jgi:hypothetical protein
MKIKSRIAFEFKIPKVRLANLHGAKLWLHAIHKIDVNRILNFDLKLKILLHRAHSRLPRVSAEYRPLFRGHLQMQSTTVYI